MVFSVLLKNIYHFVHDSVDLGEDTKPTLHADASIRVWMLGRKCLGIENCACMNGCEWGKLYKALSGLQ